MTAPVRLIVVEGKLEAVAAKRLLRAANVRNEAPEPTITDGHEAFWQMAPKYNDAARHFPGLIFGLVDLEKGCSTDKKARRKGNACPASLLAKHFPASPRARSAASHSRHSKFVLRVAVVELESWFLADAEGLAAYLSVSPSNVPKQPEALQDAKQELVNVARKSNSQSLKREIVPIPGRPGIVGREYMLAMTRFVEDHWDPLRGAERSDSLRRAILSLRIASGRTS